MSLFRKITKAGNEEATCLCMPTVNSYKQTNIVESVLSLLKDNSPVYKDTYLGMILNENILIVELPVPSAEFYREFKCTLS